MIHALERAAQLMAEVGGGRWWAPAWMNTRRPCSTPPGTTGLPGQPGAGDRFLHRDRRALLKRLHLPAVCLDQENLAVQVPSFRNDLTQEVDLIEEVARLAGFQEIPVTLPRGQVATRRPGPGARLGSRPGNCSWAWASSRWSTTPSSRSTWPAWPRRRATPLVLANPLSEEQAVMRTSLIPGLLDSLRRNALKQVQELRLFETAKVFLPQPGGELPREEAWLAGPDVRGPGGGFLGGGSREPVNFFDLKGAVEGLLEGLHIPQVDFRPERCQPILSGAPGFMPAPGNWATGRGSAGNRRNVGPGGGRLRLQPVFRALAQAATPLLFSPLPRYPAVYLDLALVCPRR